MKYKKKPIKFKKQRVILSDVLPYEVPVIFSNRHFYDFLIKHNIRLIQNKIHWDTNDAIVGVLIQLLFGLENVDISRNTIEFNPIKNGGTIPFIFRISHKDTDFRELSIIHPKNQIHLIHFYEQHKEDIKYYCNISKFSIRKPFKVAKYTLRNDYLHQLKKPLFEKTDALEEFDKEYANLKTYFSYKDYSNIFKFFESYTYQRCEKKYNEMYQFDISKCFDSIYTHSIAWAIYNKDIVKGSLRKSKDTFPGKFDKFMQNVNYSETNGIVIGPEFSRIFAEIILQRIDKSVYDYLDSEGIKHELDYEIYRYVDDFFVFYNKSSVRDKILIKYKLLLKDFKLYISDTKFNLYKKPIITELTIAKIKLSDLFEAFIKTESEKKEVENNGLIQKVRFWKYLIDGRKLIYRFKMVVKESYVEYRSVVNYSLATMDRKISKLLNEYNKVNDYALSEKKFLQYLTSLIEFSFFIYMVSPRVNSTIKLSSLLSTIIKYLQKSKIVSKDGKRQIFKKISDDIKLALEKNKSLDYAQVETSYLLIVLRELGREYRLDTVRIKEYYSLDKECYPDIELNYFSLIILIYYVRNIKRYAKIKAGIIRFIKEKYSTYSKSNLFKNTELTLLALDLLSCPYLSIDFKKEILSYYGLDNEHEKIIQSQKYWFTKWSEFDLLREIQAKMSQEVYS